MQDLDRALKELFQNLGGGLTERLAGAPAREWLNVELPQTVAPRVDLVAWLEDGALFHLEFQSRNEAPMAVRMLEYYAALLKQYDQPPRQTVLYVGSEPLRMPRGLDHPRLKYSFDLVDAGELDAEELLRSENPGENVLAILCRAPEAGVRVRRVVERLSKMEGETRKRALRLLLVLSVVRGLVAQVVQEVGHMGVVIDPMQDEFCRKLYQQGLTAGRAEGRAEGEAAFLLRVLAKRFGTLPAWAQEMVRAANEERLNDWSERVLRAGSLEEVLGRP
ncbi:MAG: DUF4351 domain-containing protein [Candidatus Solibacter usitatus]|nr:DUF4351 domain-containing protein [Candidatus Solibacter usitatus]